MSSSPLFIKRALEDSFKTGFTSELTKIAEEAFDTFSVPIKQKKPTYKQFLKKIQDETAVQQGPSLKGMVSKEDTMRNAINLMRRADMEMMESGSAPTKALAAAALPMLEGFAQRKAVYLAMNQIKSRADEAVEY